MLAMPLRALAAEGDITRAGKRRSLGIVPAVAGY
jgi:hypothetical protein